MAYIDGPKIVTDGLILNFDASDRTCYPYTFGNYLYDLTPNNFVGEFINNPHWGQGNEGYIAFRQNNTDDYIKIPRNAGLEPGYITVEAWIKIADTSLNHQIVRKKNVGLGAAGFDLRFETCPVPIH